MAEPPKKPSDSADSTSYAFGVGLADTDGDTEMASRLSQGSSPRRLLIEWANDQDGWVRAATQEVLSSNQALSSDQLDDLYARFLAEKKLSELPAPAVPKLELDDAAAAPEQVVELRRLCEVDGVNALAPDQAIDFDPCLTVLFGQNGSGKTGYARILKRLAAVRTAESILPNVHSAGTPTEPTATVVFAVDGIEQTLSWANEAGVAPFTRISVFDAPAVNLHVDDDLNYVYTPRELALFSHVTAAIRHLQETLEGKARELRRSSNPFLAHFRRETTVYPLIESLGSTTEISELDALADTSEQGEAEARRLEDEIAALKGGGVEARLETAKQQATRLSHARRLAEALNQFDGGAYTTSLSALRELENQHRQVRRDLFQLGELPGDADDEWVSFIEEADRYRQHLEFDHYPSDEDHCLYCRQALSPAAVNIIARYRTYLDDALARDVAAARRVFMAARFAPSGVSVEVVREDLKQWKESAERPAYVSKLDVLVADFEAVSAASETLMPLPEDRKPESIGKLIDELRAAEQVAGATVVELTSQRDDRIAALKSREETHAQLVARRTLGRHLEAIKAYVADAKRAARFEGFAKAMSTGLLRNLTNLSKLASEDLVNKNFERLFEEECKALRAPSVALEFQGRRGRAERRKAVARYRPSEVLSEGEQKVLAIADFLAEGRLSGVKAPIIFDDPVTSLDYQRLNEVAQRISQLGETHQVIVFTHNIFFASTLLALRTSKKLKCRFYEVTDQDSQKGIVHPDVEPRQDTPADIAKRINVLIEKTEKADDVVQGALVESCYGLMRSWCEAFVEQEVLENVTQRFRVNVMMGGLEKIRLDRLEVTTKAIMPVFDRCSRFMPGHSQPVEQLNVRPGLTQLQQDWSNLQKVRKQHLAK